MTDYEIPTSTARTCAATGRELKPGDRVIGVLLDENGKLHRKDYTTENWHGPPENVVAYWSGKVPASNKPRKPVFNEVLLFDCFDHLSGATEPDKLNFRYVVTLLLMRKKWLKFEDTRRTAETESLVLRDTRTGKRVEVIDPRLDDDQVTAAQDEVFRVLGWE
jgi:hypothetical protein